MIKHKKLHCFLKTILSLTLAIVISFSSAIPARAASLGIDVSKYQGAINWGAVPTSGVTYAFIKAGSVKNGLDPYFAANMAGAQAAGIRTGVYLYSYATSVESAVNEALLLLQWIKQYNVSFPVAYDIEDRVQAGLDANTVTAMCNAFCDVIASAGYHPIVYTGANFYRKHITPALRYDTWIAQYGGYCSIPGYSIWQASSSGAIAGISGRVDINYMVKDYHSLIIPVGFVQRGGHTYFYNNYRIQFGWVDFNNARYHMNAAGQMDTGWLNDGTGVYYLAADGHMVTGLQTINGQVYDFDQNGKILVGWQKIGGANYYFNPADGTMSKGLIAAADGIYGTSETDGHQFINEAAVIANVTRCFDANGRLVVNASFTVGTDTYICDANGIATLAPAAAQ